MKLHLYENYLPSLVLLYTLELPIDAGTSGYHIVQFRRSAQRACHQMKSLVSLNCFEIVSHVLDCSRWKVHPRASSFDDSLNMFNP